MAWPKDEWGADRLLEGQEEGSPQPSTGPSKPNRGDLCTDPGFWAGWDPMIHREEDALAAHGFVVEVEAAGPLNRILLARQHPPGWFPRASASSLGASGTDDPRKNLLPSGKVTSRPFARLTVWSLA